ncbi:hypothetical protein HDE_09015 [Halotydeus destructor]|nr:hypothetical protein HDE_09015 [Halotydeus destructor]
MKPLISSLVILSVVNCVILAQLVQKCPGSDGKNCPKGQVCAKNKKGNPVCGLADKSCKGNGATFLSLGKNANGKPLIKCKPKPGYTKDGRYVDDAGRIYPEFCRPLPGPEKNHFAVNSEMFPCFKLTKAAIGIIVDRKMEERTTPIKCAWDYILCFFFACYPGKDPTSSSPPTTQSAPEAAIEAGSQAMGR